jgi:hypothetical protein
MTETRTHLARPRCGKCKTSLGYVAVGNARFCRACREDIAAIARARRDGSKREIGTVLVRDVWDDRCAHYEGKARQMCESGMGYE